MDPTKTRGYQNHNPGNMDRSTASNWQGEIKDAKDPRLTDFQRRELTTGRFAVFTSAEWGIRAAAKNLQSYHKAGFDTPGKAIGRWAPPHENNTAAYLARVEQITGLSPNAPFDPNDFGQMSALIRAIITVELGGQPYPAKVIEDGLRLAGIVKPVGIKTSRTIQGQAVTLSSASTGVALLEFAGPVKDAALYATGSSVVYYVLICLAAALFIGGVAITVYERHSRAVRDARVEAAPPGEGVSNSSR